MSLSLRTILIGVSVVAGISSQPNVTISNLAATADGRSVYFSTDGSLRPRGSSQPFSVKLFSLQDRSLTWIEDAFDQSGPVPTYYNRPVVSADGSVVAINRFLFCEPPGDQCQGLQYISTSIQTDTRAFKFLGQAEVTANGRFAAIYLSLAVPLILLDLDTGQSTAPGGPVGQSGQFVAEDGTVLVQVNYLGTQAGTIELVGPSQSGPLSFRGGYRVVLAGDGSRIIYDITAPPTYETFEIHVFDIGANTDHYFGPGQLPMLAQDGRHFSYLLTQGNSAVPSFKETQVWIGDAVTGSARQLSNEPDGIVDQTLTGDGTAVIAATGTGRIISINTASFVVTEVLGSPGPSETFVNPVRGSYNEVVGAFPNGPPEVLIDGAPVPVIGRSPRGYAIQIPWEVPQIPVYPPLLLRGSEPLWERQLDIPVQEGYFPAVLPVSSTGPNPPSGNLGAYEGVLNYGIHQDWSGPITQDNPAHPGEIIHFYGSGWGPVDGTVATGQPTPSDRLYRITAPCRWVATGATRDLTSATTIDAHFVGLAPGLIGVYQLDLLIPSDWKAPILDAFCTGDETAPVEVAPTSTTSTIRKASRLARAGQN
jgi:uncharacterized protein (TIGR03437 family)